MASAAPPPSQPVELPQPVALDLVRTEAGWRQASHQHDTHEIAYVYKGRGVLSAGGRDVSIRSGSIYLFLPGEAHGGWVTDDDPLWILYLQVRFPATVKVVRERTCLPFFLLGERAVLITPPLRSLAEILARAPKRSDPTSKIPDNALQPILAVLAAMIDPVMSLQRGSRRQRALAESALSLLDSTEGRSPSLSWLATRLGVTAGHLGESLGAITGRTYPDLIAERRVKAACLLLADEGIPVRAVARRVGLSSSRALARLFRRITGKAPGAFRPS